MPWDGVLTANDAREKWGSIRGSDWIRTALLFAAFLIQSCSLQPDPVTINGSDRQAWSPERFAQALARRSEALKSLQSVGTIQYASREQRGRFRAVIAVERPDKIRVEALAPFGSAWLLTYDGVELAHLDAKSRIRRRGRESGEKLVAYLRIPLKVHELTAILLGVVPSGKSEEFSGTFEHDPRLQAEKVTRPLLNGGVQRIWLTASDGLPARIEEERARGISYSASFKQPAWFDDLSFPMEIEVDFPREQIRMRIQYEAPEINPALPLALFRQEPDANIREAPF